MGTFRGFSKETFDFYRELSQNNNKQWFDEHKSEYQTSVVEPAQAFTEALGQKLKGISKAIVYDTRASGSGSIIRIYRDVRFSKDKTPYKTWLGIVFWDTPGKRMKTPAYYFGMDQESARLHCGWHGFEKPVLEAYRDAVAGKSGAALVKAIEAVKSRKGFEVEEPHYKRVPAGYEAEHPRADLLRYNSMGASSPQISLTQAGKANLVDLCLEYANTLKQMFLWLADINHSVST